MANRQLQGYWTPLPMNMFNLWLSWHFTPFKGKLAQYVSKNSALIFILVLMYLVNKFSMTCSLWTLHLPSTGPYVTPNKCMRAFQPCNEACVYLWCNKHMLLVFPIISYGTPSLHTHRWARNGHWTCSHAPPVIWAFPVPPVAVRVTTPPPPETPPSPPQNSCTNFRPHTLVVQ